MQMMNEAQAAHAARHIQMGRAQDNEENLSVILTDPSEFLSPLRKTAASLAGEYPVAMFRFVWSSHWDHNAVLSEGLVVLRDDSLETFVEYSAKVPWTDYVNEWDEEGEATPVTQWPEPTGDWYVSVLSTSDYTTNYTTSWSRSAANAKRACTGPVDGLREQMLDLMQKKQAAAEREAIKAVERQMAEDEASLVRLTARLADNKVKVREMRSAYRKANAHRKEVKAARA